MIYTSSKGTKITIPDGLTAKQIAAIKADADAGYGTRAQQTANELGKKVTPGTPTMSGRPTSADLPHAQNPNRSSTINPIATVSAGLTPRQQARLDWLLKNRPKDPQVKKLQDIKAGAVPNDNSGTDSAPDGGDQTSGAGNLGKEVINPDGTINTEVASDNVGTSEQGDFNTNWNAEHPDETDQYGNILHYEMGADGKIRRTVTAGAANKGFIDQAMAASTGFHGEEDRKAAKEATYGTLTKYYDRDMSRDREQAQQEMANRGIPYDPAAEQDPNTKNLYGRTLGGIGERYRGLKDTASQQAVISGNQTYATSVAARDTTIRDALAGAAATGANYGQYQNQAVVNNADNDLSILGMSAQQLASIKGISVQEAESLRHDALGRETLKANQKIAANNNKTAVQVATIGNQPSGGSSGGTSKPTASGGGFQILE